MKKILNWLPSNVIKRTVDYLLEFRLSGAARKNVQDTVYDIAKRFNVSGVTRNGVVPHIKDICKCLM